MLIGVAYHDDGITKNHNRLTDHFVTAVGMGYDATRKQNYMSYIDNYGNHPQNLQMNRLYFHKTGISGLGYDKNFYQVTEIRPNVKSSWWPW